MSWPQFMDPVALSLKVALCSSVIAFVAGIAAAWIMNRLRFRGKALIETLLMLPLVLPPTVVGLVLLSLVGRRGILGRLSEALFDAPIVFTWQAAVIAASVVAFPLIYQTVKAGFASIDRDLEDAGRSIGASEWQVFRHITLPLASRSLTTAYVLGFARGIGEYGATLMIAGNIPGRTQTVPTAIYIAAESGNMGLAWMWTACMVVISYVLLAAVGRSSREEALPRRA